MSIHGLHSLLLPLQSLLLSQLFPFPLLTLLLSFLPLILFLHSEALKLSQALLLFLKFLLPGLLSEHLALIRGLMLRPVLLLNEMLTLFALVRLCAALFDVVDPDLDAELLLAILALLGPHVTILFMLTELDDGCRVWTELALDRFVGSLFVLLAIGLGHDVTTLATLVVVSSTADFMHSDLAHFNGPLTSRAHFGLFLRNCFRHIFPLA